MGFPQLVFLYSQVMFDQGGRKMMTTILPGNKIQVIGLNRGYRRHDGLESRIGDRARGQSFIPVGVVKGVDFQIAFSDIAVKLLHSINHGWIGLQTHVFS